MPGRDARLARLVPLAVFVLTVGVFLPSLHNGFVRWDDDLNFLDNPHYRGLGWSQLRWMFTTAHLGHYTPLTWLTLGLDHLLWGMEPRGYHLTSVLLHAATAAVFALLARRLLGDRPHAWVGAGLAAMLFAVHPLRVESAVWVTERRDVLSGGLYVLAILLYLRHADGAARRFGYLAALSTFALALLSKSMAASLPAVLLVLDVYPLRRLGGRAGWVGPDARRVWLEKVPFVALAAGAAAITFVAMGRVENLAPLALVSVPERVAVSLYALVFYLWKTLVPVGLSPLYERPSVFDPFDWRFMGAGAVVLAISVVSLVRVRRWPSLAATWMAYVAILLPVLGLFQTAHHLAADRYTYIASLPWAVLAAGAWLAAGRALERWARPSLVWRTAAAGAVLVIIGIGALTWRQIGVWRDTEALWNHALAVSPSAIAHYNLAVQLMERGQRVDALAHYRRAVEVNPRHPDARTNLGMMLLQEGRAAEALAHFAVVLDVTPGDPSAHFNQALARAHAGHLEAAIEGFRTALRLKPSYGEAHYNLGVALERRDRWPEAAEHYGRATRLDPTSARIRLRLGLALSRTGRLDDAAAALREALRIDPANAKARVALGTMLVRQRQWREAKEHLVRAVEAAPDAATAHRWLGVVLANEGRRDEAVAHLRRALELDPTDDEARRDLQAALRGTVP